jgi:hypothetical protein
MTTITQFKKFSSAKKLLSELFATPHNVLFIHYSCESFYDRLDGSSPRITSIAVRFLGSGQTKSFSIHQEAELKKISSADITQRYDELERCMLDNFASFCGKYAGCKWVHWNMRDANYGFEAIAHRHRVLGGAPCEIQDTNKVDLARLFHDYLGPKFVEHPRFQKLLERNNMVPRNFLSGKEEAEAFARQEYVKLHQSTLSKVDTLSNLAEYAAEDRLKCDNGYFKRRGISFGTTGSIIKDHPIFAAASVVAVLLAIAANALKIIQIY